MLGSFIKKNIYEIVLFTAIAIYSLYFSYYTILRMHTLYASYFDLGIMHQTVYNSYQAIVQNDWSRFLELTNPHGSEQVKRMAVHNDILLGLLAIFYLIYSGPETLLIIQSVVLGFGALAIYKIVLHIFKNNSQSKLLGVVFAICYLLNPVMQRTNIFEFHAVTLATSFLLFMFYFWLEKKFKWSLFFLVLSLLSKEEVPLTTTLFGLYIGFNQLKHDHWKFHYKKYYFSALIVAVSIIWFILSFFVIIPMFRGGGHFAAERYSDFGDSPGQILVGLLKNPSIISKYIFHIDTFRYFLFLLGPVGFLSLVSPLQLIISAPEFAINLLSNEWNMRNIIYHYTAVIQPFIFISAIYGVNTLLTMKKKKLKIAYICIYLIANTFVFAYFKGPLPFSREAEVHPFLYPAKEVEQIKEIASQLKDENLKVASTGHTAPFFTSRRYFYNFGDNYDKADYVVITHNEVFNDYQKDQLIPAYLKLTQDPRYQKIYDKNDVELYAKTVMVLNNQ